MQKSAEVIFRLPYTKGSWDIGRSSPSSPWIAAHRALDGTVVRAQQLRSVAFRRSAAAGGRALVANGLFGSRGKEQRHGWAAIKVGGQRG